MLKLSPEDQKFIRTVLAPSWISGIFMILTGIIVTGGVIVTFKLNHSTLKQYLTDWQQAHTHVTTVATTSSAQSAVPTVSNSWPLFFVWGFVGLIVYAIAAAIIRFILQTIAFRREMNYMHADPVSMIKLTIEHVVMKIVAAGLLLILVFFFIYRILPIAISDSRISATNLASAKAVEDAVISFLLITFSCYAGVVLTRLTFGRARILGNY
jgi:hypothetical protein